jgi:hypothetical protein
MITQVTTGMINVLLITFLILLCATQVTRTILSIYIVMAPDKTEMINQALWNNSEAASQTIGDNQVKRSVAQQAAVSI